MDAHRTSPFREHDAYVAVGCATPRLSEKIIRGALTGVSSFASSSFAHLAQQVSSRGTRGIGSALHHSIFSDLTVAWAHTSSSSTPDHKTEKKKKKSLLKKTLVKLGDSALSIVVSVVAGVAGWLIIQWLRGRRGDNGGDDDGKGGTTPPPPSTSAARNDALTGREAYTLSAKGSPAADGTDMSIPRPVPTAKKKEVTFIKRRSEKLMLPQVRQALLEGYSDRAWGTLIARIVDARFEGTYEARTRNAERFLRSTFGLGIDEVLMRAPARTHYFLSGRIPETSRYAAWWRGALTLFGVREEKQPLTGYDIYHLMSRRTEGGIGLGVADALQVALLWVLKETGISLRARAADDASEAFLKLAAAFHGADYIRGAPATPYTLLVSRINFQLRSGCRFVREPAMMAHFARYVCDRFEDKSFAPLGDEMLSEERYLEIARTIEARDMAVFNKQMEEQEFQFVLSLQNVLAARLKYFAVMAGNYGKLDPRALLEEARTNAIDALQRVLNGGSPYKTYSAYAKDVAKDIGMALDTLRYPGGGESPPQGSSSDDEGDMTSAPVTGAAPDIAACGRVVHEAPTAYAPVGALSLGGGLRSHVRPHLMRSA
jgi:hypothetical protein